MAVFRGPEDESEDRPPSGSSPSSRDRRDLALGWFLIDFVRRHRGKFFGVVIGLWAGFGVMEIGFWWTLFISATVGVGYFIGKRLDDNQENFWEFLDRVLPPGRG